MNKENFKENIVVGLIYVVGMLSVSIANIFGNHYGFVAAIVIVLSAVYAYNLFEGDVLIKKNLINIIGISIILFFEFVFFVVNDLFNVSVYIKNDLSFLGILVVASQIISVCGLIYLFINLSVVTKKETTVEIIETTQEVKNENTNDKEENFKENVEETKEIKFISNEKLNLNVPFMEEEK